MVQTEDSIARDLRKGALTLDDALRLFAQDQVYVYEVEELDYRTASWEDVEDHGAGSATLFKALRKAGATEPQMDEVMTHIQRASDAGRTIQSTWPKS